MRLFFIKKGFYGPHFLPQAFIHQKSKTPQNPSLHFNSSPLSTLQSTFVFERATLAASRPGLIANALKRKDSFIQLFIMTGIFMLSCRSLSQKYRIDDLSQDNAELRQERDALANRMAHLKDALRREAALDQSGALASHLSRIFADSQ